MAFRGGAGGRRPVRRRQFATSGIGGTGGGTPPDPVSFVGPCGSTWDVRKALLFGGGWYAQRADNASLDTVQAMSLWFMLTTKPGDGNTYVIAGRGDTPASDVGGQWTLEYAAGAGGASSTTDTLRAQFWNQAGTRQITAAAITNLLVGVWYHCVVSWDGVNLTLRVNDSVQQVAALAGTGPNNSSKAFSVGSRSDGALPLPATTRVDSISLYSQPLPTATITSLFNDHKGPKRYSEMSAGDKTNMVSHYEAGEQPGSGCISDLHGTNHLTVTGSSLQDDGADWGPRYAASLGTGQYLTIADHPSVSWVSGSSRAWWGWIKPTVVNNIFICGKGTGVTVGTMEFYLRTNASGQPQFFVSDGTTIRSVTAAASTLLANEWNLVMFALRNDGAATVGFAHRTQPAGVFVGTTFPANAARDAGDDFTLGRYAGNETLAAFTGWGVWNFYMDNANLPTFWRHRYGNDHANLTGANLTGNLGYWRLNEAEDVAVADDANGTLDLTYIGGHTRVSGIVDAATP